MLVHLVLALDTTCSIQGVGGATSTSLRFKPCSNTTFRRVLVDASLYTHLLSYSDSVPSKWSARQLQSRYSKWVCLKIGMMPMQIWCKMGDFSRKALVLGGALHFDTSPTGLRVSVPFSTGWVSILRLCGLAMWEFCTKTSSLKETKNSRSCGRVGPLCHGPWTTGRFLPNIKPMALCIFLYWVKTSMEGDLLHCAQGHRGYTGQKAGLRQISWVKLIWIANLWFFWWKKSCTRYLVGSLSLYS